MNLLKAIVRFIRRVFDEIEELLRKVSDDELVARALEADLGLPPGSLRRSLDKAKDKKPDLSGIDQYIGTVDPDQEKLRVTLEFIEQYVGFWRAVFEAAREEDSALVVDELLYRLYRVTTVDLIKFRYPGAYYLMRLTGLIYQELRIHAEDEFAPERLAEIFGGDYWANLARDFQRFYRAFRLDQADDLLQGEPPSNLPAAERLRRLNLGFEVFGWSDLILLGQYALTEVLRRTTALEDLEPVHFYGWEQPPESSSPDADRITTRAYSLKLKHLAGSGPDLSATITQLLVATEGAFPDWLVSLRGDLTFEEKLGPPDRELTAKIQIGGGAGLDLFLTGDGVEAFGAAGGMSLSIARSAPSSGEPAVVLPDTKNTRLEIGNFSSKIDLRDTGFKAKVTLEKSALVIVASNADGFLAEVLRSRETRINFDLAVAADQDGVYLEGGGRLSTTLPISRSIGPIKIQTVQIALGPKSQDGRSEIELGVTASLNFKLGPLLVSVDQIGFRVDFGFTREQPPQDAQSLLPFFYLRALGYRSPAGLGLLVDSPGVTGGGFLFIDEENDQYAGVLQLEIGDRLSVKVIGLVSFGGETGFSLLLIVTAEGFTPIQIGLGFTINGVGGLMVGIHRSADVDALRQGLRNRTLDAVLFPKDPVANAGRIINVLRTVFPPVRDRHLFGPMFIIGWGTPTVLTINLAVIVEISQSPRLVVLAQLKLALPARGEKKIIVVNMDALGVLDFDRSELSLDARLYDSRILAVSFSGDMALRLRWGRDRFFLLSIGGFHPDFVVPPGIPRLERVKISLADSKTLRLNLTAYLALSSNTKQLGGRLEFFVGFAGFSIEGRVSLDVLLDDNAGYIVDLDIEVALKYKGRTLLGASLKCRWTGPDPDRFKGKVSVDLFLFDVSKDFDKTFGEERPPASLPVIDPLPELVAALQDQRNWSAQLAPGGRTLVTFRARPENGEVLVHPLGEISVRQQVLPLDIELARFGAALPGDTRRFTITQASIGDQAQVVTHPLKEFFAPAQFLELTNDEKLARPSFEEMPAGVVLETAGLSFGGQAAGTEDQTVVADLDFEPITLGRDGRKVVGDSAITLDGSLMVVAAQIGPAGRSPLRATGPARFRAPGPNLRVRQADLAVAGVDDLDEAGIAGLEAASLAGLSFTAVLQALERTTQADPQARQNVQIVPAFRVLEEAP